MSNNPPKTTVRHDGYQPLPVKATGGYQPTRQPGMGPFNVPLPGGGGARDPAPAPAPPPLTTGEKKSSA
jgi:hypothetical protein